MKLLNFYKNRKYEIKKYLNENIDFTDVFDSYKKVKILL